MEFNTRLEINFYQQDEASVFFESTAPNKDKDFAKLLTISLYVARMLSNLGSGKFGSSLATILTVISEDIGRFKKTRIDDEAKLVKYESGGGRKNLVATLEYNDKQNIQKFKVKTKGFGFLGRGLDYYSPMSTLVLIRYFLEKDSNKTLENAIAKICGSLASAFYEGNVTVVKHHQVAMMIALKAAVEENLLN